MISEIGVKQISYPAFDPSQQDAGKQLSQPVRAPDKTIKPYGPDSKEAKGYDKDDQGREISNELLQAFKNEFDLINNVELKFNKDEETGQTYIKIVDKETGDVIREIPPEEVRKLAEKLDEMVGILFDKKV